MIRGTRTRSLPTAFGIDFGTTCGAVSSLATAGSQSHLTHHGERLGLPMPSACAINTATGEYAIGHQAAARRAELSESFAYVPSIKRQLGTDWHVEVPQGTMQPADLASLLFRNLRSLATKRTGLDIREAVVAIPIGFDAEKRRDLRHIPGLF